MSAARSTRTRPKALQSWHGSYAGATLGMGVVGLTVMTSGLADHMDFLRTFMTVMLLAFPITIPMSFLGSWIARITIALEETNR